MSMRPIDLQTVVPRVGEVARVDRVGQQEQEKAAAQAAGQNRETSRRRAEEVPEARSAEQREVVLRKEREKERRPPRRRPGRGGRQAGAADPAEADRGSAGDVAAAGPGPEEPGQRLDIRV